MKGKLGKIPVIFILAMFLMSFVAVFPVNAVPADIWMDPSTNPPAPGPYVSFTWEITIWVDTHGASLFAYQVLVDLSCLDDYVEVVSARNDKGDGSWVFQGKSTVGTIPVILDQDSDGNTDGAMLGDSILVGAPFVGVGTLGVLELHIKAAPGKGETIDCIMDIVEGADTFLLDDTLGDIPYSATDGTFYWEWAAPDTHPHAAVHNPGPPGCPLDGYCTTDFLADGGTNWNCTDFDVDVYICTLDPMWGLTTATLNLQFDPTQLDIIGGVDNITINPIWPVWAKNIVGDTIELYVEWPCGIDPAEIGDFPKPNSVLVATIRFHIFNQKTIPPEAPGYKDEVDLIFTYVEFWDHTIEITPDPPQNGKVTIEGFLMIEFPWLEVVDPTDGDNAIVMGPEPSICKNFDVDIVIHDLDERLHLVGVQFRLSYDPDLISMVECNEGPFMTDPWWNLHGTFPICWAEPPNMYPQHVLFGDLILPDPDTGIWERFPNGTGVICTITFHVDYQSYPEENCCPLDLIEVVLADETGGEIPYDHLVNGTYCITTDLPGRMIDLYTQYPAPFGGQGPNMPSDMFDPQKIVRLYVKVTYNYYPVNNKDVGFEVEGPFDQETGEPLPRYQIWLKDSARTNKNGIAWIEFQLPWPCQDPEGLFGKWKVTATVDICTIIVNDTLTFDYLYVVMWESVTIDRDPPEYNHCDTVEVTVTFKSKSQQKRWVLISVVLKDELITPVGIALVGLWVEGAEPCHYVTYTVVLRIHVPQHAFAGIGHLHVNAFTKDPTIGGVPWCPGYTPLPEVWIQPW